MNQKEKGNQENEKWQYLGLHESWVTRVGSKERTWEVVMKKKRKEKEKERGEIKPILILILVS